MIYLILTLIIGVLGYIVYNLLNKLEKVEQSYITLIEHNRTLNNIIKSSQDKLKELDSKGYIKGK